MLLSSPPSLYFKNFDAIFITCSTSNLGGKSTTKKINAGDVLFVLAGIVGINCNRLY